MRFGLTIIWDPPSNSMLSFFEFCASTCVGDGGLGEEPDLLRVALGLDPVTISDIVWDNLLGEEAILFDMPEEHSDGDTVGIANVLLWGAFAIVFIIIIIIIIYNRKRKRKGKGKKIKMKRKSRK